MHPSGKVLYEKPADLSPENALTDSCPLPEGAKETDLCLTLSDASGKAVKATAAGNRILGFALVSGASGDIIPYQYSLGTLAVAAAG